MNINNKKLAITHPQKRIWYNELLFPETSMHNIVLKINMGSGVNIDLLEKAINIIIERNDSLRLKFYEEDGQLYEYVDKYKFSTIPFLDLSKYNGKAEEKLKEFCMSETAKSLYKQEQLLFKFFIYKINDGISGVCVFVHHIIFDGMSCNLLLKQLVNVYSRLCNSEAVDLSIENSYIDFINDEQEYLNSEEYKENKKFWNDKFSDLNENSLYINCKSAKSKVKSFKFNSEEFKDIKGFLIKNNISLNRFFIAVSSIYMSRIFDDNDITLAVACFNRSNERQKNTMGMFTGTMPLRVNIEDGCAFGEFLDYLNGELKACYKNQKYPYDSLVQDLQLKKRGADSLFKFCINYYVMDSYDLESNPKIKIYNQVIAQEYSNIPLQIFIKEIKKQGDVELEVQYRVEDYTENQIEQMINGINTIAKQIIGNYYIKVSEIQVVSEKEKDIILNKFNDTKRAYAKDKTIKEMFEETVEKSFDKTALVSNGESLTYKELNERSNKLARVLKKKGISREDIVPILCDRSVDTIIAMLAVIKSGGAYLPIDDDYPQARIEYMLKDSGSRILLFKQHQLGKIDLKSLDIELIDLNSNMIFKESEENLENINKPKDLVYVIYTSGSTGNPKGVCIENRNLVKFVNNPDYIDINQNDKVLQSGSLSFDASVFQIWIALLNGAALHLEDKLLIINEYDLEDYIDNNKITVMLMPTPLFNKYTESHMEIFKNLRVLIAGGDVLSSRQVSRIVKVYKDLRIINGYGPTENTVLSTTYEVKGDWDENVPIPIGRPISNSTAYIMDKNNNLLPIGVPGELCVGGDGLGRGYLNREELTKERFIENPYVKGERIYKSGDLAKYLPDGNIDFIGRIDYQVKINGFRIEMQEIEAKLLKYPKIKEAVVADKKDNSGDKYLCAYVVSEEKVLLEDVKTFLRKEIPSYMVPAHILQLESLPVNANGKVDRKALPVPDLEKDNYVFATPRNEMERKLENIWCSIFNVEKVSIEDNFFDIGGNSLTAISLVSKINKKLSIKVSITDIFNNPSIKELAEHLNSIRTEDSISFSKVYKAEEKEYYEASAVQKRIYAINQSNRRSTNYNIPFAYLITGDFNRDKLERAVCELINRHEALRTSFCVFDGDIVQKVHSKVKFKAGYTKVNKRFDAKEIKIEDFVRPFDLSKAPLIHAEIIEFKDVSLLIIDIHHIVSDGISMGIIMKELSSLYNGNKLEDIKIQYKDFSEWQNNLYKNGLLDSQEKYWIEKFKGEIPELNIRTDYKNNLSKSFSGNTITFEINKEFTQKINDVISELKVTKFMFYAAVYYVLLYKYTAQNDLIIGVPVSGRTIEDFKNTVGMFVNTLPLRNKINPNMTFREFLSTVKKNSLEDFNYQNYDLKNLIDKLDIKRQSLFDVIFSFQDMDIENLDLCNLDISAYKLKNNIAKFPISMILEESDGRVLGELEYQTELYKKETIEGMADHYLNIVNKVLESLDSPIDQFDILSEQEKDLILNKFNNTKRQYAKDKTVKEIFEDIAQESLSKTALVSNGESLTYKQLNERSNKLARLLKKRGVSREEIVPILCDRSKDTIIAMLAVIKTGAAYLPIDEDYPQARIEYMLKDSHSRILLIKKRQMEKIDLGNIDVELLDLNNKDISKESPVNLEDINSIKDLVYVIYTSGSTGNPKGVCIEHRNLVNLTNDPSYIDIKSNDRILQSGSLSFDASMLQIWIALLNGAALYLEEKTLIINESALERYIDENKITIMVMPTSLFNQYSESSIEIFKNLRYVMAGGDVLSSRQVSRLVKVYKDLRIINGYGPTENTVLSTVYEVKGEWDENFPIPIGRPISNSTAYIMDKNNNLLPIGVPGELCVGGDGIGRGYLNREELTKERFIENPYVKGERIYKTGDLAEYLPDGNIHFIGRIDYQVKINGFRIELQEIEAKLIKYPKLKEVVVTDKKDSNGNKYLCAYVVSNDEISSKEVKEFLKKEIPAYMIPSYIVQLQSLPVNSNGKVDRKLLPDVQFSEFDSEYIKPKNYTEEKISQAWSEVLGIENISTELDFFEIGGNSLKAISLVSKLSKEFAIAINDIFKYPTIQGLAENIKLLKSDEEAKHKQEESEAAVTVLEEEIQSIQAIKPDYDLYIDKIEKYKNKNLSRRTSYKNVLLTGSTGYVGINILKELMVNTKSTIYLLLRGNSIKEAENKIIEQINFYFGEEFYFKYRHRIKILVGDISDGCLGLESDIYKKISLQIDCIINCAANVKHYGRYEEFYEINVLGTKNLLDFARYGMQKDFNQISTISVGNGNISNKDIVMFSEDDIDVGQESDNVYVKSKLEAEKLVAQAGNEELNTKIFRLGNVTFNYETGLFQRNIKDNAFYQNIKSFIKLGCIPAIHKKIFDFSYVDQLSKAIILLFNRTECNNQIFHIENPEKLSAIDLLNVLTTRYKNIELRSMDDFIEYVSLKREEKNLRECADNVMVHLGLIGEVNSTKFVTVSDRTNAILRSLNFEWSRLDEGAAKRMIDYCEKIKFL